MKNSQNPKDFYGFNDAVHNAVKTMLNETGEKAKNMTVFVLVDNGESCRCISAANGEYKTSTWGAIVANVFRRCVNRTAAAKKPDLSLEEARFHAYQALLISCIADGLDTVPEEDD